MMPKRIFLHLCFLLVWTSPAIGEEQFWLLRELSQQGNADTPVAEVRPFGARDNPLVAELFGRLPAAADTQTACNAVVEQNAQLTGIAPKPLALRGVGAVGLDLTKLKPPPGFDERFGQLLQNEVTARLQSAGLRVLTPEAASEIPGSPLLSLNVTFTDPNGQCAYTFSASGTLSQTAVLTRDTTIKIAANVWSASVRSGGELGAGDEMEAALSVVETFIAAWVEANSPAPGASSP